MAYLVDAGIAAASLGLFALAYGIALLATRPARPRAAAATPDLGAEPPALVNLLANRWRLNDDAAESTVLDLAARRIIELRQPADDPYHTTIHLREEAGAAVGPALNPYERRVLDRIRGLAVGGVVPVTALTFRDRHQAKGWNKRLHREVTRDARGRGLSRRRFSPAVVAMLAAVALPASFGLAVVGLRLSTYDGSSADPIASFWFGLFSLVGLIGLAARGAGDRDTAAGREAAARWLGVREWLRGHEEFANLPPSAVAVWDRYLPYGAALGVTRTASAVLDLGLGDRRRVWSSYRGSWRRVRVRYPRVWRRYGATAVALVVRGVLALAAGLALVRWHTLPSDVAAAVDPGGEVAGGVEAATRVVLGVGIALAALGAYLLVRTLLDLATVRTITGEVLWREKWRTRSGGKNRPAVTWLDYLAVDDGSSDGTRAWGLPRGIGSDCGVRDTVTIRVRPWSRRVMDLTVVERGRAIPDADVPPPDDGVISAAGAALGAALSPPASPITGEPLEIEQLLTAEEVGQAFGEQVGPPARAPMPGFMATVIFSTTDRSEHLLMVQMLSAAAGRWSRRVKIKGTMLDGIGDAAAVRGTTGVVRVGDVTVSLNLVGPARQQRDRLPWLLVRIAARLTAWAARAEASRDRTDQAGIT